jgi:hypothetical protein
MGSWGPAGAEAWSRDAEKMRRSRQARKAPAELLVHPSEAVPVPPFENLVPGLEMYSSVRSPQAFIGKQSAPESLSLSSPGQLSLSNQIKVPASMDGSLQKDTVSHSALPEPLGGPSFMRKRRTSGLDARRFENAVWRLMQKTNRTALGLDDRTFAKEAQRAIGLHLDFTATGSQKFRQESSEDLAKSLSHCPAEPLGGPAVSQTFFTAVNGNNASGDVDTRRLENAVWRIWQQEQRRSNPKRSVLPGRAFISESEYAVCRTDPPGEQNIDEGFLEKARQRIGLSIDFPQTVQQDLFSFRNLALGLSKLNAVSSNMSTRDHTPRSLSTEHAMDSKINLVDLHQGTVSSTVSLHDALLKAGLQGTSQHVVPLLWVGAAALICGTASLLLCSRQGIRAAAL